MNRNLFNSMPADQAVTDWDILQQVASRVKEYRLAMRMSQRKLAQKSGVGDTAISHFEQGLNPDLSLKTSSPSSVAWEWRTASPNSCRNSSFRPCPCAKSTD